jgi:hypothetical protein
LIGAHPDDSHSEKWWLAQSAGEARRSDTSQDGGDLVAEAIEEHHVVATLIEERKALDPRMSATIKVCFTSDPSSFLPERCQRG